MQNWNLLCSILLNNDEDHDDLETLAIILYESVYQTLKGKSSKLREHSRIGKYYDRDFNKEHIH